MQGLQSATWNINISLEMAMHDFTTALTFVALKLDLGHLRPITEI